MANEIQQEMIHALASATIWHPEDELDSVVQFRADLILFTEYDEQIPIAEITGYVMRFVDDAHELWLNLDAISTDAAELGSVATRVFDLDDELEFMQPDVLCIDRMRIADKYRGNRLTSIIIDKLATVLQVQPGNTVVVLVPVPQKSTGGSEEDSPRYKTYLKKLKAAYEDAGFTKVGHGMYQIWDE